MTTKKAVRDMTDDEVNDEIQRLAERYSVTVEKDGGATATMDTLVADAARGKAEEYEEGQKKQETAKPKAKPDKKKVKKAAPKPSNPKPNTPKPAEPKPSNPKPTPPKPTAPRPLSAKEEEEARIIERDKERRARGKANWEALKLGAARLFTNKKMPEGGARNTAVEELRKLREQKKKKS